ncbi:MAG: ATP-binding protein [Burkholderiaceae bacterium]|nr:ATP-binding protein [Burkholderiaceae bacterium]
MRLNRLLQVSLFWRTFVMLVLLLLTSSVAWLLTFRTLETESRAMQSARQISSAVNLTRSSLVHADAIYRTALIKNISDQEGLHIRPREITDKVVPYIQDQHRLLLQQELQKKLGANTVISGQVNGETGLWVSFSIQGDEYWLQTEPDRFEPVSSQAWLYWVAVAIGLSMLGAAVIARLINRPLKLLSQAANQVRVGNFAGARLDETVLTTEIHNVYRGFNQMTDQLSKVEADRTVMLAGISHDLRTPLARLRLETELSVADADARTEMSTDIEQINGIIGKFLDYARPNSVKLQAVMLADIVDQATQTALANSKGAQDIIIEQHIPPSLRVMADPVELLRILSNLLENARRYGKSSIKMTEFSTLSATKATDKHDYWSPTLLFEDGIEVAHVDISAQVQGEWVVLSVRDHGSGVPPNVLNQLKTPFFRANNARSDVTGSGLGLAIVEKTVQGMQGQLKLSNVEAHSEPGVNHEFGAMTPYSGFLVQISLKQPPLQLPQPAAPKTPVSPSPQLT